MFGRCQGDLPIAVGEAFQPLDFVDAFETDIGGQITHAPRHDADFGGEQTAQRFAVKMIEVGMSEQNDINWREILELKSGAADAFDEKEPIGKVRVDEDIEVGELGQKGGVADPSQGDLAVTELGEFGEFMFTDAGGQKGFPDQFIKKGAGIKMLARGEILEGSRQ